MITANQLLAAGIGILAGIIIGNLVPLLVMDWLAARERRKFRDIPFYDGPKPIYPRPGGY